MLISKYLKLIGYITLLTFVVGEFWLDRIKQKINIRFDLACLRLGKNDTLILGGLN